MAAMVLDVLAVPSAVAMMAMLRVTHAMIPLAADVPGGDVGSASMNRAGFGCLRHGHDRRDQQSATHECYFPKHGSLLQKQVLPQRLFLRKGADART
jgi:hypothetical protein